MATPRAANRPTFSDFKPDTLRGTPGFFRVGQTQGGRWWLLDALDRPFFSKGVTAINRAGTAGGRSAPRGPYFDTIDARFGTGESGPFVEDVITRLRTWNFNTLGAWTTPEFFDRGMPYMDILDFRKISDHAFRLGPASLPDVFDPRWIEACDRWAGDVCSPLKESRQLIGYFTDHELGWAQFPPDDETGAVVRPTLLQICLSLEPAFAAYHAAWEFVLAPHAGDLAALARSWAVQLPNKEALRQLTLDEQALQTPGYREDHRRFTREFARRYFSLTAAAIRRYDPHHLILGCRFTAPPGGDVLSECVEPHVDVLSANHDRRNRSLPLDAYHEETGLPVLVGEFSWSGDDFAQHPVADEPAGLSAMERMHRRGRALLMETCAHPSVVGYAWNRWVQGEPRSGPPFDSGLVYTNDLAAREHTDPLAAINAEIDDLRAL